MRREGLVPLGGRTCPGCGVCGAWSSPAAAAPPATELRAPSAAGPGKSGLSPDATLAPRPIRIIASHRLRRIATKPSNTGLPATRALIGGQRTGPTLWCRNSGRLIGIVGGLCRHLDDFTLESDHVGGEVRRSRSSRKRDMQGTGGLPGDTLRTARRGYTMCENVPEMTCPDGASTPPGILLEHRPSRRSRQTMRQEPHA